MALRSQGEFRGFSLAQERGAMKTKPPNYIALARLEIHSFKWVFSFRLRHNKGILLLI